MRVTRQLLARILIIAITAAALPVLSGEEVATGMDAHPAKRTYFGDLHARLDALPTEDQNAVAKAFRFARGESIELPGGIRHQLKTPLDFAAVTIAVPPEPPPPPAAAPADGATEPEKPAPPPGPTRQERQAFVEEARRAAVEASDPGAFTAMIAVDETGPANTLRVITLPGSLTLTSSSDPGRTRFLDGAETAPPPTPDLVEIVNRFGAAEAIAGVGNQSEAFPFEGPGDAESAPPPEATVRNALKLGLVSEAESGSNSFKPGFTGGTATGNGTPGDTEEDRHHGHDGSRDNAPAKRLSGLLEDDDNDAVATERRNPGGLTGVWASDNTREELLKALRRRETWATSGTRLRVRFFGGFAFTGDMAPNDNAVARQGEAHGVSMGGDLSPAREDTAPRFLVSATRDPQGANLDRIQIIKGWVDESGVMLERVYDVAWAGGDKRKPRKNGVLPEIGSTVDARPAVYRNTIGASQLAGFWVDPDFDPSQPAFYYARVLEIPTPRFTTFDAARLGIDPPRKIPAAIRERAWTSPIWYAPPGDAKEPASADP